MGNPEHLISSEFNKVLQFCDNNSLGSRSTIAIHDLQRLSRLVSVDREQRKSGKSILSMRAEACLEEHGSGSSPDSPTLSYIYTFTLETHLLALLDMLAHAREATRWKG